MNQYVKRIKNSGLDIYHPIPVDSPLWLPTRMLEHILNDTLTGIQIPDVPLRTRSKIIKGLVCTAIGYPVPKSFKKTKPRFLGQNFDIYIQKSRNLQIWNEEIDPSRRYVIICEKDDYIQRVKVIPGADLAILDKTGTLTKKYQAHLVVDTGKRDELVSTTDTETLLPYLASKKFSLEAISPVSLPSVGTLLPIQKVYEKLRPLLGIQISDCGTDQERNRGGELHKLICKALGYRTFQDNGQFPDILQQLVEVKLQTAVTIDLGLVLPNSTELHSKLLEQKFHIRYCDIRYALFYAKTDGINVTLTNLYLTTGADFFGRFPRFQGNTMNTKLQIPLPLQFFN